jgi:hypothetical protein
VRVYGFARSEMTDDALRERVKSYVKGDDAAKAAFLERLTYVQGVWPCTCCSCRITMWAQSHAAGVHVTCGMMVNAVTRTEVSVHFNPHLHMNGC